MDVALWEGVPKKDLGKGCRGDVAAARSRLKALGRFNFEVQSLG